MATDPPENDPRSLTTNSPETDPARWGHSLANAIEFVIPCLDAVEAASVAEIGAYAGDFTLRLLDWAAGTDARVTAVDPLPAKPLIQLAADRPNLELIREPSHTALLSIDLPDAMIIDGDHNYYTVSEELRIIGERTNGHDIPLLIFHDVCWPHGRRDAYYSPDQIPDEKRQPMVEGGGIFPGEPGLVPGGLPYQWPAAKEGGAGNGVLTAIEDFVDGRLNLRLAVIPVFFGVGIVWDTGRPWSDAVARIVDPVDRNPVLERLEANRVFHLASQYVQRARFEQQRQRSEEIRILLNELLASSAFRTADRVSQLRRGSSSTSWQEQIEFLLRDID